MEKKLSTVDNTRYLGVTIFTQLNWTAHINTKIEQCSALLRTITQKTSSYYGPKPKLMRWVYTGIIRPKLTYGALVWAHNISTKQHKKIETNKQDSLHGVNSHDKIHTTSRTRNNV